MPVRLLIATCSVDYAGRLSAHLPTATRLILVKADGSVSVHADDRAYKPLNWMSPPCSLRIVQDDEAHVWTVENKAGERRHGVVWNGDPWHKYFSPYLFRLEESEAIWRQIRCPVLWVAGRDSWVVRDFATRPGDWERRQACFAHLTETWIENADHMLHHDQPADCARLIEEWFKV